MGTWLSGPKTPPIGSPRDRIHGLHLVWRAYPRHRTVGTRPGRVHRGHGSHLEALHRGPRPDNRREPTPVATGVFVEVVAYWQPALPYGGGRGDVDRINP